METCSHSCAQQTFLTHKHTHTHNHTYAHNHTDCDGGAVHYPDLDQPAAAERGHGGLRRADPGAAARGGECTWLLAVLSCSRGFSFDLQQGF